MSYREEIPGIISDGFEVGNVYIKTIGPPNNQKSKVYFMAINKKTLVTRMNGRFGKFTTRKDGHSSIGISVSELCARWEVQLKEFDEYMLNYFQPDEEAKMRARKEKYEEA